ncbi:hypothetical protein BDB00DRAFT_300989 [Zychaea mexicana]|uniref:uncharacterized protein n=1 Tax=Zychaea mexicana TaxID=64656 RepID=UPI0022FF0E3B|nr:uncharacterized protein BDB00DRAFT_300989 [Zychaea mexicana]KAI9494670.1 hypothetical protein BDB00DRAFT_300989 [Zychaea mexicana]
MTTTTEVKRVVRAYLNDHENPSVAEFVATHVDFIKQNTPSGKLANKVWPNIIRDEAARLRKILTKNRVSWKVLCASTSDNHNSATSNNIEIDRPALTSTPSHNNAVTTSSSPAPNSITPPSINSAASSSSLGKRSRSSSAKTDSYELTPDMKEEYKRAFEALDDNKKWVLDDGTKVEDAMYAYGANCTHEQ